MNRKFILVSGSASRSCPREKLNAALGFVSTIAKELLKQGYGLVVLAGDEESTIDEHRLPLVFDWVVLREVERFIESTTENPRLYARIVMSDKAPESKIAVKNLKLLTNLQQRGTVELVHIQQEEFTGGEYRKTLIERADAMVAIGGGKGTYLAGTKMVDIGKPVLPLDLRLGSSADDGGGAVALHKQLTTVPSRFFPNTHQSAINRIGMISLNRGTQNIEDAARVAVEMIDRELDAISVSGWRAKAKSSLSAIRNTCKTLPMASSAIRIVDFIRGLFLGAN